MTELSKLLNDQTLGELKRQIAADGFPGLDLSKALEFCLTDGVLPASGLPVQSFLDLEDWLRSREHIKFFTATDLKNKTGTVMDAALQGKNVIIRRHGRPILTIRRVTDEDIQST